MARTSIVTTVGAFLGVGDVTMTMTAGTVLMSSTVPHGTAQKVNSAATTAAVYQEYSVVMGDPSVRMALMSLTVIQVPHVT